MRDLVQALGALTDPLAAVTALVVTVGRHRRTFDLIGR
jgi:hypothetical protein